MKRSELRACFKDIKDRFDNVSNDPCEQRLEYQTLVAGALATIKRVLDTGLVEMKND